MISLYKFKYKKGLLRLWIILSFLWLGFVGIDHAYDISFWAGYHYSLIKRSDSFSAASEDKKKMATLSEICKSAYFASCNPLLDDLPDQPEDHKPCNEKDIFPANASRYLENAGLESRNPEDGNRVGPVSESVFMSVSNRQKEIAIMLILTHRVGESIIFDLKATY